VNAAINDPSKSRTNPSPTQFVSPLRVAVHPRRNPGPRDCCHRI